MYKPNLGLALADLDFADQTFSKAMSTLCQSPLATWLYPASFEFVCCHALWTRTRMLDFRIGCRSRSLLNGGKKTKRSWTHLLVSLLLPLGDEDRVCVAVLEQPVVQWFADGLFLVVELVDIAAALMRDLEYRPLRLVLRYVLRGGVLRVLHLDAEHFEVLSDVVEACWRLLAPRGVRADGGHGSWTQIVAGGRASRNCLLGENRDIGNDNCIRVVSGFDASGARL